MVLHNPNNWHWVSKDTSGWARQYLEKELIGTSVEDGGVSAKVDKVMSMEGDVDVNQRKGKVITLFDVKLQLEWRGKTKDDEDASGTITIPEVAHDTEEDEYVFDIDIYSETSSKHAIKDLIRTKMTPLLRSKLHTLGPALIAEHGKYIQHAADSNPGSGRSSPAPKPFTPTPPAAAASKTSSTTASSKVNVTTVSSTEEFRTSAAELYATFTDPQRVAAFTRAPPKVWEGATVGSKFELFGGNVSGTFKTLEAPTRIVQSWRLAQWPAGHFSELDIRFEQNDVDAVTVMRVEWRGVPIGQEEVTKRNWGEYYVRSIKTTFGFGTIL